MNDGVCHSGHKVGVGIQPRKAVPAVRVRHIEEIDRLDIKALFPKVRRHHFKKLSLRISHDHGLRSAAAASLCAAHEKGNDKAPGLIRARSADTEDIVVLTRLHAVSDIGGIPVGVIGMPLDAAEEHTRNLPDAAELQMLAKLSFRRKAGGAVSPLRENVKAARITGKMIAGKAFVALPCEQADQKDDHSRRAEAEGCKHHKEILEGVEHPDALHLLAGYVKYGFLSEPQGVEQHPIEVPAEAAEHGVQRHTRFVALIPASPSICSEALYLFQEL